MDHQNEGLVPPLIKKLHETPLEITQQDIERIAANPDIHRHAIEWIRETEQQAGYFSDERSLSDRLGAAIRNAQRGYRQP